MCDSFSTKKVVGVSTISRLEHATAQTREVQCTRQVLPDVIERGEHVNIMYLCTVHLHCMATIYGNTIYTPRYTHNINFVHIYFAGLKVVEVAHDYQPQVQKYVVDELKLINSYDTWHGKTQQYTLLYHEPLIRNEERGKGNGED